MKFRIFFFLLVAVVMTACQNDASTQVTGTLSEGYEYIMHTSSTGDKATPGAIAYVRYAMRNDDKVVVSNYDATSGQSIPVPAPDAPRQLNPIEEALLQMAVGDSLTIIVPLDTLTAEQRPEGFKDYEVMYYDIKLEALKSPEELQANEAAVAEIVNTIIKAYNTEELENIQTTATGLKYLILEEGTGVTPEPGDFVYVDYYGALLDGSGFDNSYRRGTPFAFQVGRQQVIPGWDEGLTLIPVGTQAIFFIPAELGYGDEDMGLIPPGSELVFFVNLNDSVKPE